MIKKIDLSIVCPVYNEGRSIYNTLTNWIKILTESVYIKKYEIIITDDCSTDNTIFEIEKIKNNHIKLHKLNKNYGPGYAINNSLTKSNLNYILIIDSDGQFNMYDVNKMIKHFFNQNCDVVNGIRDRKDTRYFRFGAIISNYLCNLIYNSNIPDFSCAMKFFCRESIKNIKFDSIKMNYSIDHTAKFLIYNKKIISIKVQHRFNTKKRSFYKILILTINRFLFITILYVKKLSHKNLLS